MCMSDTVLVHEYILYIYYQLQYAAGEPVFRKVALYREKFAFCHRRRALPSTIWPRCVGTETQIIPASGCTHKCRHKSTRKTQVSPVATYGNAHYSSIIIIICRKLQQPSQHNAQKYSRTHSHTNGNTCNAFPSTTDDIAFRPPTYMCTRACAHVIYDTIRRKAAAAAAKTSSYCQKRARATPTLKLNQKESNFGQKLRQKRRRHSYTHTVLPKIYLLQR